LACPNFPISTPWAYEQLKSGLTSPKRVGNFSTIKERKVIGEDLRTTPFALSNDLEAPVIRRFREVEWVKKAFLAAGFEQVLMSGSGPSVWAAFKKTEEGQNLQKKIKSQRETFRKALRKFNPVQSTKLFVVHPITTCSDCAIGGQPIVGRQICKSPKFG
jgi:4-diphosphocytidyl-2C-methyl-D-erythritol kinase